MLTNILLQPSSVTLDVCFFLEGSGACMQAMLTHMRVMSQAGPVSYCTDSFLDKNRDQLSTARLTKLPFANVSSCSTTTLVWG